MSQDVHGWEVESLNLLNAQDVEALTKMRNDALKDPLAFVRRLQEGVSGLASPACDGATVTTALLSVSPDPPPSSWTASGC